MSEFPYGEVLPPEASFGTPQRSMLCITGHQQVKIFSRRPYLRLKWKCFAKWGFTTRKIGRRGIILKILLCESGWWRVRLFDNEGFWDLCFVFTDHAAIFPSAYTAIAAAEIFTSGQHWEVANLVWQDENGGWFVTGGRQSTCAAAYGRV